MVAISDCGEYQNMVLQQTMIKNATGKELSIDASALSSFSDIYPSQAKYYHMMASFFMSEFPEQLKLSLHPFGSRFKPQVHVSTLVVRELK